MNKWKVIFIILLILFASSYFVEETGYYDYKLQEKTTLTKEQMKKFEQDVANGNNIDISSYLEDTNRDYSNRFTKGATKASLTVNKYLKKSIEAVFGLLNNLVDE